MTQFPVSSSILSATHLNNFLQEKYKLDKSSSCSLIKAGINHTYLVTTGAEKYVFRIYSLHWRSQKEISEELRLITWLKNNNIPVSYPIADYDGKFIHELPAPEGDRFGVLFSYAAGEKMFNFSAETHFVIGETMANIHLQTKDVQVERCDYNAQTLLMAPFEELKKFIAPETDEMIFMAIAQQYLLDEFKKVNKEDVRQGAVHLDIWFDNLNVDAKNNITLFDFDFCGNGWLCLDIAYYLLQLYVVEADEQQYWLKQQSFFKGYESNTTITCEEKRILPMLGISLYFFYLGVQCQRFDNYANLFLNDTYLKRYISLRVKKYFDFHRLNSSKTKL